jgi:hypothetical protein
MKYEYDQGLEDKLSHLRLNCMKRDIIHVMIRNKGRSEMKQLRKECISSFAKHEQFV